jgi:hypothetical protein
MASTRTAQDYEILRASVLSSMLPRGSGIGTVCHQGLASWLKQPAMEPIAPTGAFLHGASSAAGVASITSSPELTRVIVDIVVALASESGHV